MAEIATCPQCGKFTYLSRHTCLFPNAPSPRGCDVCAEWERQYDAAMEHLREVDARVRTVAVETWVSADRTLSFQIRADETVRISTDLLRELLTGLSFKFDRSVEFPRGEGGE